MGESLRKIADQPAELRIVFLRQEAEPGPEAEQVLEESPRLFVATH